MRKLKAIYLIPVVFVLLVGGAFAGHYMVIIPKMNQVKAAEAEWQAARDAAKGVEADWLKSLEAQVSAARQLLSDHATFAMIQQTMPNILNMKARYGANAQTQREGLTRLYEIMGRGLLIKELDKWAAKYHLSPRPGFTFRGTLGYESTLTDVRMIKCEFGVQTLRAQGFAELLHKISARNGYGYCPLIIVPQGDLIIRAAPDAGAGAPPLDAGGGAPEMSPGGGTPGGGAPTPPPAASRGSLWNAGGTLMAQAPGTPGAPPPAGGSDGPPPPGGAPPNGSATPPEGGAQPEGGAPAATAPSAKPYAVTIRVHRNDPRHRPNKPMLSMQYVPTGYLMTRGWEPIENYAQKANAPDGYKALALKDPRTDMGYTELRTDFSEHALQYPPDGKCPKLLWLIERPGIEPGLQ